MGIIVRSAHEEKEYLNLVAKDEYSGWSYLFKQSVSDISALVRPCAHGSIHHQWDASPLRFSHCPADSAPTRGSGDDGPRLQQLFHLRKLVLGTKSVENYINAIYQELGLSHDGILHPLVQAVLSYIRDCS